MGMLPIVVVLASFILLWGMVNYHSFVTKRKAIADTLEARRLAQIRLGDALIPLLDVHRKYHLPIPSPLSQLPNLTLVQRKSTIEELMREADQLLDQTSSQSSLTPDGEFERLRTVYGEAKKGYFLARKRHRAAVNGYNAEARHMPSKIVAKIFGFQPSQ
ncbi:MAG: LemA family protein [Ferruginibacter sp.]|nr:LemA family protein [Cytophagales bacterium]